MADDTKVCPQCAETIKAAATLCRFCQHNFLAPAARPAAASAPAPSKSGMSIVLIVVIVLLGGPFVIGIIAAIAIPGLLSSQRAANERNASATLKTFASAEADFRANDRDANGANDFWVADVRSLYYLTANGQQIRLIEPSAANADNSPGGNVPVAKAGYYFMAVKLDENGQAYDQGDGRNPARFAFCAYPSNPSAGKRTFLIDENNTVWWKMGVHPVKRLPKLQSEGWKAMN